MEVHDLASLAPLQTFDFSGATCMTTCPVGGGQGDLTYVATANSVNLLKLIPIEFQVCFHLVDGMGWDGSGLLQHFAELYGDGMQHPFNK